MAFRLRRLLDEPDIPKRCEKLCDGTKNPDAICPVECVSFCPDDCYRSPFEFPPPYPPPPPPPLPSHASGKPYRVSLALTVSLAVLAAAFFFFTCYTAFRFYSNWRNSRRNPSRPEEDDAGPDDFLDEDHGPLIDHPIWYIRTVGLQPSVISAITIVKYKKGEGLIEGTDCSVCLNEFEEDETLRLLPKCNHAFHIPCIDTWLRSHTNCPMCRAGIVSNSASSPSAEVIVQNPGQVEEARNGDSENNNREAENEASEVRIGIDIESRGLGLDEDTNLDKGGLDGIQPVRRSVSFDSLSASMISAAIANVNSGKQLFEVNDKGVGLNQSRTAEICGQTGSSSVKRSLSCSAKVFLSRSRHSDSSNPQ